MKTKSLVHLSGLLLLCLFATPSHSAIFSVRPLGDLVAEADLVAVGEIVEIHRGRGGNNSSYILFIADELLKGEPISGPLSMRVEGLDSASEIGAEAMAQIERGFIGKRSLIFATITGDGSLSLLPFVQYSGTDARSGDFMSSLTNYVLTTDQAASQPLLEFQPGDDEFTKTVKELATIVAYSGETFAQHLLMPLAWDRAAGDVAEVAFEAMRASNKTTGIVKGTTGLMALGGVAGARALSEAWEQSETRELIAAQLGFLEDNYRSTDPEGIAILSKWLSPDTSPDLRAAAAGALARIHTAAATVELGDAFLSTSDFQVQWRAVGGLAMFANSVPIGGGGPDGESSRFSTAETMQNSAYDEEYTRARPNLINFWKNWWVTNQQAIHELAAETTQAP